ncbi:type II secretion system protein GspM [Parahaliea aestuarii]|uniref:Type II secretion system protein M n=1 Tax=Parahaliea aestuarii TaxID=1852021 RepID=A0A5C9A4Q0_9GAMM|nr:type II secretion system protein GspM [Parahaliea aestuarii]TXS94994.1 type II secretion system protein M [Parahaliea aestuarii]
MNQWFARFSAREQLSLLVMAIALLLYLAFMLLWKPLDARRDDMQARNAATAASLQRVDTMVSEILALREGGDGAPQRRNLTSLVNQTTAAAGLAVSRLQPNSRGEIQVRFEGVEYAALAGWLYEVEFGQALLVRELSLTQSGSAGRIDATVRLGQGE